MLLSDKDFEDGLQAVVPAAQPRTLQEILDEATRLAPASVLAARHRALIVEAYALGAEVRALDYRKSLGQAYSAMLGLIPDETWLDIRYGHPDLWERLRAAFLSGKPRPAPSAAPEDKYLALLDRSIRRLHGETWNDESGRRAKLSGLVHARALYAHPGRETYSYGEELDEALAATEGTGRG